MMSEQPRIDERGNEVLDRVGEDRRAFLRKIIAAPYALPVVTSFTLTALAAQPAMGGSPSNMTVS
jgi:hypothetical protein